MENKNKKRILVACEESQAVTIELRKLGHEAYSCDLLPCSGGHPEWHLQQDVSPLLKQKWDMIIAFPLCTDLAVSGSRWFPEKIASGSQQKSIDFFMLFANSDCEKIVIENPIGIMSTKYRKPDQIIQPWNFGDKARKSTCLWLKGLPQLKLEFTNEPELEYWVSPSGKRMEKWMYDVRCKSTKNGERAKAASKTFPGIAKAIAEQYGNL